MREKKEYIVLSFRTTQQALAMEQYCAEHGGKGRLIPLPGEISAGCGLAWRMECGDYEAFADRIPVSNYEQLARVRM